MKDHYTFGDNARAVDRLKLLADVYEPTTARLLNGLGVLPGGRALDLGCGPGYTTELLHRALAADETWGLDASARMIERAREDVPAGIHFAVHDVTSGPLSVSGVDVAYARHVLTHIAVPRTVLWACETAVRIGGLLVLEENCALESSDPAFADYYRLVEVMQAHYGQNMYVGTTLPGLADGTAWRLEKFERTTLELDARAMARLHAMNVQTWSADPFAAATFDAHDIARIAETMDAVATGRRRAPAVSSVLGQAVLRR